MSSQYNATVTLQVPLAPGIMVFRVKLDGEAFPFEPGQYTVLGLLRSSSRISEAPPDRPELQQQPEDYLIRRAYSITSNSKDRELEFVITLIRSGDLTPRLFALKPGSRLFLEPKAMGAFTLKASSGNRDLLLVGTGPALAPYLSMLRTSFPQNPEHQYVIIHAAAVSWDLAFRPQLEALAEQSKHLSYLPVITDPERDRRWNGLIGSVEQLLKEGEFEEQIGMPITPERFDAYLAGNPQMIDSVAAALISRGFKQGDADDPATNIHIEKYW